MSIKKDGMTPGCSGSASFMAVAN